MVTAWAAENADDLTVKAEKLVEETETRIALSNDQGRALCAAFLEAAST
jgi:hypothetical protein